MRIITFFLSGFLLLFAPFFTWAQVITISGQIIDETSGKSLRHVSVFEKKQGIGTISNDEGYYKLLLKPGEKTLKITSSGFQDFSETFRLLRDTTFTVSLLPESSEKTKSEYPLSNKNKTEDTKEISVQRMQKR